MWNLTSGNRLSATSMESIADNPVRNPVLREIADQIGAPGAARAVGLANGHNPIAIIVPCHRVIGASGKLTGYGGGINRKRALLELEKSRAPADLTLFD